jgi:hypothetical protein
MIGLEFVFKACFVYFFVKGVVLWMIFFAVILVAIFNKEVFMEIYNSKKESVKPKNGFMKKIEIALYLIAPIAYFFW